MYYIGVDLGGTNIAAGIVEENGTIIRKASVPTLGERNYQEVLKDLAQLCIKLMEEEGLTIKDIHSIGIGSPGTPDPKNGIWVYASNLNFDNIPICAEVRKYIDVPVYIENDANCAALGESTCGAAKGYNNSLTITLGTGVGSGIIIGGKIYSGSFFAGGEIGHHVINVDGELCGCGRKGCWEAYASATGLIRDARISAARYPHSEIFKLVNGDIRMINAKTPFDAAEKGDEIAIKLVQDYIKYVAIGLANIINIFQPEVIVIGGGVCAQGEVLRAPLEACVKEMVYGGIYKTKLVIATLGNDAGIVGAAMLHKGA